MLVLNLELPTIGFADSIIEQKDIPCHIWIGKGKFLVKFSDPVFDAVGTVTKWERKELEAAAPANGGGDISHDNLALITLKKINDNQYKITELSLFEIIGWLKIMQDGEYCEYQNPPDEEEYE